MKLLGSCHCTAVRFECESQNYMPYQLCYCSICRKTQGGGGFAINLSAESATLKIKKGKDAIKVYRARLVDEKGRVTRSSGQRNFCGKCGSALWLYDPSWPELIHPFASAIDTDLPPAPEKTHLMLASKASWVKPDFGKKDKRFKEYPKESIAEWHDRVMRKKKTKAKAKKKKAKAKS